VADFIIEIFASEEQQLSYILQRLNMAISNRSSVETTLVERIEARIFSRAIERITSGVHKIEMLEQRIRSGNPLVLLEKGYAIPLIEGERVRSVKGVKRGDKITLVLADGRLDCLIEKTDKYEEE
jgi:exodeoxyribonuclease VII large subunit